MKRITILITFFLSTIHLTLGQTNQSWSLKACIEYALKNNLKIQKSRLNESTAQTEVKQAISALFPSLSASMTQSVAYRPFQENSAQFVNGSKTSVSNNKASQSGSYGINASWTIWNGKKNIQTIKSKRLNLQMTELATETETNDIQEQIAQLYIQILYLDIISSVLFQQKLTICYNLTLFLYLKTTL